jgi:hypothetical protein
MKTDMRRIVRLPLGIAASGVAAIGLYAGFPSAAADNPVCSEHVCAFYSPSHTISCEIDYQRDPGIADSTYCQINRPDSTPQSVHMDPTGKYTVCGGESCLGNPGLGQPTLAYGQSAGIGPFTCRSDPDGVTCTVRSGCGFAISSAGIVAVHHGVRATN